MWTTEHVQLHVYNKNGLIMECIASKCINTYGMNVENKAEVNRNLAQADQVICSDNQGPW